MVVVVPLAYARGLHQMFVPAQVSWDGCPRPSQRSSIVGWVTHDIGDVRRKGVSAPCGVHAQDGVPFLDLGRLSVRLAGGGAGRGSGGGKGEGDVCPVCNAEAQLGVPLGDGPSFQDGHYPVSVRRFRVGW